MNARLVIRCTLVFLGAAAFVVACGGDPEDEPSTGRTRGGAGKAGKGSGGSEAEAAGAAGRANGGAAGSGACVPSCVNRYCGAPDGCGSFCADCPSANQICDAKTKACVSISPTCMATCAGKTCGQDDGCGAPCTICPGTGKVCDVASKQCVAPGACVPSCAGKTCGQPDGCNGKCTACPANQSCNTATGTCSTAACVASCAGKTCGQDDGCGQKCTACADPAATCNPATGQCKVVCKPDCTGKSCGDDNGCGAKCGGCPGGNVCDTATFTCKPPCQPQCAGKACGDADSCGGKCNTCPEGKACSPTTFACQDCQAACTSGCLVATSGLLGAGLQFCRCPAGEVAKGGGGCEPDPACAAGCGPHGTCARSATPVGTFYDCVCEAGYVSYSGKCVAEGMFYCRDRDGSLAEMGTLRCSADDTLFEVCRDANGDGLQEWVPSGNPACPAGSTCSACRDWGCKDGVACPEGMLCVPTIHEQKVDICVGGTCDCSNCGTCNAGDFSGFQASCGAANGQPPTVACKQGCPGGNGCIPFTVDAAGQHYPGICYPAEGCFGAAP